MQLARVQIQLGGTAKSRRWKECAAAGREAAAQSGTSLDDHAVQVRLAGSKRITFPYGATPRNEGDHPFLHRGVEDVPRAGFFVFLGSAFKNG